MKNGQAATGFLKTGSSSMKYCHNQGYTIRRLFFAVSSNRLARQATESVINLTFADSLQAIHSDLENRYIIPQNGGSDVHLTIVAPAAG